ncbi:hypothetical protein MGS_00922 [Candida albicans P78042]|mgnify:FL=1|nr:hypothetical protein MG7_00918 [Candida albicans P34048]KGU36743.1 hypothetical protein MGK_00914 [Candida albicans P57055]KHC40962.1 hypothetical protein MGO_00914 [Candida albicans P76055]KHC67568.1 hypothetical protein MGE_00935 [Candida albicans P75010]KHC84355.1 hypothetical protein MGS_00922 [Candida albicans P78042]
MIAFYFDDLQRWIYIHHHDVYLMKLFQSYFCILFILFYESLFFYPTWCSTIIVIIIIIIFYGGIGFHSFIHLIFHIHLSFYYVKVYRVFFIIITDLKYIQHFHVSHNFMAIHCSQKLQ